MQVFDKETQTKLEQLYNDYLRISELLTYEEVLLDNKLCIKYQKTINNLQPLVQKYQEILNLTKELENLNKNLLTEQEKLLFKHEKVDLQQKINLNKKEVIKLLDNLNANIEKITIEVVKSSENFSEQLQNDIVLGYQNYFKQNNIDFETVNDYESAIIYVSGLNTKKLLQNEVGLHVANIKNQECACKVFVYDSYDNLKPTFNDEDIKIEVCRASGAGGQHINTTDSSIKITHLKTGIVSVCQNERSQFQNKQTALLHLKTKVWDFYNNQRNKYIKQQKTEQIKLIKQKHITKVYDYNNKTIKCKKDGRKILLTDFLSGNDL